MHLGQVRSPTSYAYHSQPISHSPCRLFSCQENLHKPHCFRSFAAGNPLTASPKAFAALGRAEKKFRFFVTTAQQSGLRIM